MFLKKFLKIHDIFFGSQFLMSHLIFWPELKTEITKSFFSTIRCRKIQLHTYVNKITK